MYSIKTLPSIAIKHLKGVAEKEGLLFPKKDAKFFCMLDNDEVIGFAGMNLFKNKAILKNVFILEEHRGKGLATELIKVRILLLKGIGIKIVEANCTKMSLNMHLKQGAKIVRTYKNGITKVSYENI